MYVESIITFSVCTMKTSTSAIVEYPVHRIDWYHRLNMLNMKHGKERGGASHAFIVFAAKIFVSFLEGVLL